MIAAVAGPTGFNCAAYTASNAVFGSIICAVRQIAGISIGTGLFTNACT